MKPVKSKRKILALLLALSVAGPVFAVTVAQCQAMLTRMEESSRKRWREGEISTWDFLLENSFNYEAYAECVENAVSYR